MLINFKVSNFRSIKDEVELNLCSIRPSGSGNIVAKSIDNNVVSRAALFGENADGKTNILTSYIWLADFVRNSLIQSIDNEYTPTQPFRTIDNEPSSFKVEMEIDGILYSYELVLDSRKIHNEKLTYYPNDIETTLFNRADGKATLSEEGTSSTDGVATGFNETDVNVLLMQTRKDTILVLSIAKRFALGKISVFAQHFEAVRSLNISTGIKLAHPVLDNINLPALANRDWLVKTQPYSWFRLPTRDSMPNFESSEDFEYAKNSEIKKAESRKKQAINILKMADPSVTDVEIKYDRKRETVDVSVEHSVNGSKARLDKKLESDGFNRLLLLTSPILTALDKGSLIIIDEIELSLHPLLLEVIVEMFSASDINTKGSQLIMATHNTQLIGSLERDEVWFAEKKDGATSLFPLSDFRENEIDEGHKRVRQYLEGRFGGVPHPFINLTV